MEAGRGVHERFVRAPRVPRGVHGLLQRGHERAIDRGALRRVGDRKVRHRGAERGEEGAQHVRAGVAQEEQVRLAQVLGAALGAEHGHHLMENLVLDLGFDCNGISFIECRVYRSIFLRQAALSKMRKEEPPRLCLWERGAPLSDLSGRRLWV